MTDAGEELPPGLSARRLAAIRTCRSRSTLHFQRQSLSFPLAVNIDEEEKMPTGILCLVGIHVWGDWKRAAGAECLHERRCLRCNKAKQKVIHNYTEGSPKTFNGCCHHEEGTPSVCIRCGHKNPVQPTPVQPQSGCYNEQICSGCGRQLDGFMNC